MKKYFLLLCLSVIFAILSGCSLVKTHEFNPNQYHLYHFDSAKNKLVTTNIILSDQFNRDEIVYSITEALYRKIDRTYQSNISSIPTVITINNGIAQLDFAESFNSLSTQNQMLARVALIYTLTDLNFISGLTMTIADEPITTANGVLIGVMNRSNIILNTMDPNPPTNYQTLKLYFLDEDKEKLVLERRGVEVNKDVPIEKYILEELIKGPTANNLLPTLPSNTIINYIVTKDGVCQVDLSSNHFKEIIAQDGEQMMVDSIVNSLTEVYYIEKVGLLIDGKREVDALGRIDLNLLFGRNESVIAN